MNVKLDTKEKFTAITPIEAELTANMTEEMQQLFINQQKKDIPHVILNMSHVMKIDESTLQVIIKMQEEFYNDNHSFVICEISKDIIKYLDENDLLDTMNVTPTESEAWDIVQMEEIERELLSNFDEE